jgi:hypothetical protein
MLVDNNRRKAHVKKTQEVLTGTKSVGAETFDPLLRKYIFNVNRLTGWLFLIDEPGLTAPCHKIH